MTASEAYQMRRQDRPRRRRVADPNGVHPNMKRMVRSKWLIGVLLCGAVLTQLGPCGAGIFNGLLATVDFCSVLGPDCTLGPIAPCGDPNTTIDDLLLDCPRSANTNGGS